jgi:hypothetical protein
MSTRKQEDVIPPVPAAPVVKISTARTLPRLENTYDVTADEAMYPHTVFEMRTVHYRCSGKMGLPVSGPAGTEMEIVELCAPWGYKVVLWVAHRDGKIPELPDMDTTDDNEELFDVEIGTVEPKIIDGERYSYHLSGKYTYLCKLPPNKTDGYEMGRNIVSGVAAKTNVVPSSSFTTKSRGK